MGEKILTTILPQIDQWGYYAVFLMTFLESSAFVGLLVPGESVAVMAGLLAAIGIFELGDVIWAASLGAIMGDTGGYLIGRRFGEAVFLNTANTALPPLIVTANALPFALGWVKR